jgi:hypothetical protein
MTGERLVREVLVRREHVTANFYAMGLALRELSRPERYRDELGFQTFEDLVEQRYLTSKMTAAKLIAVASTFPEDQAVQLGVEKGYALIRYASIEHDARYAVVMFEKNEKIGGEPVLVASVRDINEAAKRKRESLREPRAPSDDETTARRAARATQAGLRRAGMRSASARAHRHAGVWCVRIDLSPTDALALTEQVEA